MTRPRIRATGQTDATPSRSHHEEDFAWLLHLEGCKGWVREYRFAPPRKWRFDFAWIDHKIAVEIEGGAWSGGRHTRGKGFVADCEKYNTAASMGWTVYRIPTQDVDSGEASEWIGHIKAQIGGQGESRTVED